MKKVISLLAISIFLLYWVVTLIFNMPDNYIKLSLGSNERTFQFLFSQKWEFFAPPPDFNERLYITFLSEDKKNTKTLEILKPILDKKKADAPFNRESDILDYLISNSMNSISDLMTEEYKIYKFNKKNAKDEKNILDTAFTNLVVKTVQKTNAFKVIENYAKIVASRNNINNMNFFIVCVTKINILKFYQRFEKTTLTEEMLFKSDTLRLYEN
jgi:hypothetical protein